MNALAFLKLAKIAPLGGATGTIVDPLRDEHLGPKGVPQWGRRLGNAGRGLGLLEGFTAAVAGPAISAWGGHHIGEALESNHWDATPETIQQAGQTGTAAGGVLGGLVGLRSIAPRAFIPATESAGLGMAGKWVGKKIEGAYPRVNKMVERIHQSSPEEGAALIQQAELGGRLTPDELAAMRKAHEIRRQYLADVAKHAAAEPQGVPQTGPLKDPLEDTAIAPKGVTPWHHTGESVGKTLGTIAGGVAGAALPPLLGYELGGESRAGAALASPLMAATLPAGMGAGYLLGGAAGNAAGHAASRMFQPAEHFAVEKIKKMSPAEGFAYIRAMERMGKVSPSVLAAMRTAHEYRRRGLQYQLAHRSSSP